MVAEWIIFSTILLVLLILAGVLGYASRNGNSPAFAILRPVMFAITSALFLTTAFGQRLYGMILRDGWGVLAYILGPVLMVGFGLPFIRRVAKIVRIQHIQSFPGFLSARYGNKYSVSVVAVLFFLLFAVVFFSVQIQFISDNSDIIVSYVDANFVHSHGGDMVVAAAHQQAGNKFSPILLAILVFVAIISFRNVHRPFNADALFFAVSLTAAVYFVLMFIYFVYFTYYRLDGVAAVIGQFGELVSQSNIIRQEFSLVNLIIMTIGLSFSYLVAPWQFQIIFVNKNSDAELGLLQKIFIPFLSVFFILALLSSLAIIVILEGEYLPSGLFVSAFKLDASFLAISFYFANLVATILLMIITLLAVSTMVTKDLILPLLIKNLGREKIASRQADIKIEWINRAVIISTLILAFVIFIYRTGGSYNPNLALYANTIFLQLTPAFVAGVYWNKASFKGLLAGFAAGISMGLFTLLLPNLIANGTLQSDIAELGLFGLSWLRPTALFGLDINPIAHGAIWSILANILALIGVSLYGETSPEELAHNRAFIDIKNSFENPVLQRWQKNTSLFDLQELVGQYLGRDVAQRRFRDFAQRKKLAFNLDEFANTEFVEFAKQQLTATIGASSARFVMALIMERKKTGIDRTEKLLDEASEFIQHNREILQSAIDNINQGICVLDENLKITFWNKAFLTILDLPADLLKLNTRLENILEFCAQRGDFGDGNISDAVSERILNYVVLKKTVQETLQNSQKIVEVTSSSMPEGGSVITFDNVTDRVTAANELASANVYLEHRVEERMGELTSLNDELSQAKASAEEANIDKTRFLAAASHDISQPMNAARLYSTALLEQDLQGDIAKIAHNLDLSLTSVEEILVALLDISRLDSGVFTAEFSHFSVNDIFEQLFIEFKPLAEKKGLKLGFVPTQKFVYSDRKHLRRILQNFISNAIKYTASGRVLFGARLKGDELRIDIYDTGHGIAPFQIKTIFKEFKRLESGMRVAQGVGLGLSIVDRISKMLGSKIDIASEVNKGSRFSCFVKIGTKIKAIDSADSTVMAARNKLANLNVVCIDNEVEILDALETLLSGWGINGIYSETSKDALALIKERGIVPDAIIADYHLNFENGVFAIEKIRWQIDKPITAILATADRTEQVSKVCKNKDIILMYKPLKPAILRAILGRIDVGNL
ncbi:MAG: PAS-domain containing protein [Rhizobiales bacterium]|nr:PAS-domain containing protein [Hyphomicrobiales bacterium]NRB13597.1 PAS-domain containing protein [Hyphomicrobiales bacterium]